MVTLKVDSQDSTAMDWWRDNFWIILAVAIIIVSTGLGLIMYCVCRWQLRQGKKWEIAKPLKQNQRNEEKMYENVVNQSPIQLPPLPPRGLPPTEDTSLWETPSQPPVTYSSVHKVKNTKTVSIPSYIDPEDDYDDVEIPVTVGNHHFEKTVSSFWMPFEETVLKAFCLQVQVKVFSLQAQI
ncbi:SLP adapter and CSK-interacting membrane protein [Orycteropus afer afer]|uniref:SLP adapter and CSK-interacting membrane protein n=1 Tax=Orycteropus afer afer TaxID=1230840 RepID=A0AC54Z198_ORYAF|nr:SLP adapter and CSK-interacting membrane protein [Orycteropus afer afer]